MSAKDYRRWDPGYAPVQIEKDLVELLSTAAWVSDDHIKRTKRTDFVFVYR